VYDCQKQEKLVDGLQVRQQIKSSWIPWKRIPLKLTVRFYFGEARSSRKAETGGVRDGWHIKRPDLSNLIKYIEDVCQGIVYDDDCSIVQICASKEFSTQSYTEFWFDVI
jgi:Holliday junction resolvase RusA-like endonuclease